jgi:DNA-binding NarL/FixJ family response regulator
MPIIKLVLADDHRIILDGLAELFTQEPDCAVLACCTTGGEALQAVRKHRPDILVLDLRMPGKDGFAVLRGLQKGRLAVKVVVLTADLDDEEALEAIRLGVRGVVLKEMAVQQLVQCVRKVYRGGDWLEKNSVKRALESLLRQEARGARQDSALLTAREKELVRTVAQGLRNKEMIARELSISEGTVKIHLHNIYEKLSVKGRMELAMYARDKGLTL